MPIAKPYDGYVPDPDPGLLQNRYRCSRCGLIFDSEQLARQHACIPGGVSGDVLAPPGRCPRCGEALDDAPIDPAAATELLKEPGCRHCGGYHAGACPRIKTATWVGDSPSSTEYWPDGGWCRHNVLFRPELLAALPKPESPA